eukprot:jgi/Chrzof1/7404/Cz02g22020.t1
MPQVVQDETNGMDKVILKNDKDIIFTSQKAIFKPPKAIRGGVPVCFPQFGQLGPLGQHGFARNTNFELADSTDSSATLVLKATGTEDPKYPHPFELTVKVELLDDALQQELSATNTGSSDLEFTAALHTYYKISDISKVRVEGLDGVTYSDSLQGGQKIKQEGDVTFDREVDRIYVQAPDTVKIMDEGTGDVIEVSKVGFPDAVVWNPWIDKSKAMADFGDAEYKEMLCIEPAVALSGPQKLSPGASWSGKQVLKRVSR